jgi:hypothetical protein
MSSRILNARSLTKFMPDRDEDAAVANLMDDWQPPPSALPEVRQYRKQLVQHVNVFLTLPWRIIQHPPRIRSGVAALGNPRQSRHGT